MYIILSYQCLFERTIYILKVKLDNPHFGYFKFINLITTASLKLYIVAVLGVLILKLINL